ncbi:hypothetical protein ACJ73_08013 [Blastomyces percursus]|uniref:Uncharacterized protein n=1 Tax=Blastomyces percursus TaxID=1658174 RepID=A0A1J9QZC2_9EURO|nr:hypothetical protein ACJ73_08013 [Blastomyces percursus]
MSQKDPTSKLSDSEKRQLAFVLYSSDITVDSEARCLKGQKPSSSLLSNPWTRTKSCTRHEKLNGKLSEYIFDLIKFEVSKRIDDYTKQRRSITETEQYLRQLNTMWMDSSRFAKEYGKPTGAWPYQMNKCDACMVARVAQNALALKQLRTFLEARALKTRSQRENASQPRLLFWVKAFLDLHETKEKNRLLRSKSMPHSHDRPRPLAESVPERKLKTDWTEMTRATIEKWQGLEASRPTNETYSGHALDCYTTAMINRSLTVGHMENDRQRSRRARQQLSRNQLGDKSTSNNVTDHHHTLGRSHSLSHHRSNESDYLVKNDPRTPDGEPLSYGYSQQGNYPCQDAENPQSRRHSVASPSSNYSLSPPATPVMEQPMSWENRYDDALFSPAASETRPATAAGTAAVSTTCAGAGRYGSNGNYDTDLESVPGLEHDTDARYEGEHGRSDATKVAHQWEQGPPQTSGAGADAGDSDSEWDDDLVYDGDEGHSHAGGEHRGGDGRANGFRYGISNPGLWHLDSTRSEDDEGFSHGYGYNVAHQGQWDLDLKELLTPVEQLEQPGGMARPPRHAASSASVLIALSGLLEDRGEEWNNAAISRRL